MKEMKDVYPDGTETTTEAEKRDQDREDKDFVVLSADLNILAGINAHICSGAA